MCSLFFLTEHERVRETKTNFRFFYYLRLTNNNELSTVINQSDLVDQTFVYSEDAAIQRRENNIRRTQNVLLIWLDKDIDNNSIETPNTINQLKEVINDINIFNETEECLKFINSVTDTKACMIISDSFGQDGLPHVHNLSQTESIFICCDNKEYHQQWTEDWPKNQGCIYRNSTHL